MSALFRRGATSADEGMTLVELLVAMVLLTVVIGLSTGSLIFVLGKQSNVAQSSDAAQQTQTGMELLSRVIRQGVYPSGSSATSTIIQTATATQLKITSRLSDSSALSASQLTSTRVQYTFTLTGTTLYWQQASVSCVGGTCTYGTPSAQKALIRGVRNTSGATACGGAMSTAEQEGPFHYVILNKTTGVPNAALATVAGTDPNTPDTYIGGIAYVTVSLFTQTQTGPQAPSCTRLSDYVQLRNKT